MDPEALIEEADDSIDDREFDDAVPSLIDAVEADEEQLPAAEERFQAIREARAEYVRKGREVEAQLRELISAEIPPEQVVPTAFQALALIEEMNSILPNPNPEDARLISNLESRVLLTIDRRRFQALMAAAARELEAENYVRAAEIYVNGLGEYGFELPGDAAAEGGGQTRIQTLLETDGIAIQIGSFTPEEYGLTGQSFAAARQQIRNRTVAQEGEATFAGVAEPSLEQAREMVASFTAGDFEDAQEQVADYLPLLRDTTDIFRTVRVAGDIIAELEAINAQRAVEDDEYRYNWHIRFVNDIVLGRPLEGAADQRRDEGVLHAIETVWDFVANAPVAATRDYGAGRYAEAVTALREFPWRDIDPNADDRVREHEGRTTEALNRASASYRTTLEIVNVARELALELPAEPAGDGSDLLPVIRSLGELPETPIREALLEAATRAGSADQLAATIATAAELFEVGTPLASTSVVPPLERQRASIRELMDDLTAQADTWREFAAAATTATTETEPATPEDGGAEAAAVAEATPVVDAAPEHAPYLAGRLELARDYELAVVQRIAAIELEALDSRLASMESTVTRASRDLAATDPVSNDPRPRTAQARDLLRPLVGRVAGTRITTTSTGDLQELREDATALATGLRNEEPYIEPDAEIQATIRRADEIASTVGTNTNGLLADARGLLQRALDQIAEAERLEELGFERADEIASLVDEAEAENEAGNVLQASVLLDEAEDVLSSNNPNDASNLFLASLQNWYRPDLETRWNDIRERLSSRLNTARREIVLARVNILAEQAQPLLEPPDERPGEAILLLEEAEALWETVYPLIQNPTITPLLRRARILESQQQQELTEETPGFERLSQILNTARTAFDRGNYDTAQQALDFFLTEQPLNAEARLLDIRLEFASGEGSPDAIVRGYVTRSLDEVTTGEDASGDGPAVERAILSENVSEEVFGELLELRSKLGAIEQIIEEQGGVSTSTRNRITRLQGSIEQILNPPQPPPPPEPRIAADEIIDELPPPGTWQNLPVARQTEIYQELERARAILPGYERTTELIQLMQVYLPTARTPTPTEQAIMSRANVLVGQGDLIGAVNELERYMAVADDDPMLIPDWRELYNDLQRRLRRR